MSDEQDYVPGGVDPNYDYTKDDIPFKTPDENYMEEGGFDADFGQGTSVEEIEKSILRFLQPGTHVVQVKTIIPANDDKIISSKVYLKTTSGDVRPFTYDAKKCMVVFNALGDDNLTIRDQFMLPPLSPDQLEAYDFGFTKPEDAAKKKRNEGGFWSKKLKFFLARLGFQFDARGQFPPAAKRFANWVYYPGTKVHRLIKLDVVPQKLTPYPDKTTGQMVMPTKAFNQVGINSYCFVPPPIEVMTAQQNAARSSQQSTPVPQSVPETSANGSPDPVVEHEPEVAPVHAGKKKKATQV